MRIKRLLIGITLSLTVVTLGALPAQAQEQGGVEAEAAPAGCPAVPAPVPIEDQRYRTGTNPRHTLDIYPARSGPKPIVITVHGGGWIGGDNSGKRITCITQALADLGYAVFSINYRQATPQMDGVPMQTNDIGLATKWVKANGADYGGDTSNITLLGGSSGAQLVALAGLLINKPGMPPVLRGVIPMSGVMDFLTFFNQPGQPPPGDEQHRGASTYLGCVPSQCTEAELKAASPYWRINGSTCPDFLVINGQRELLPASQATEMHRRLLAAGCTSNIILPNTTQHGLALFPFTEGAIVQFLDNP